MDNRRRISVPPEHQPADSAGGTYSGGTGSGLISGMPGPVGVAGSGEGGGNSGSLRGEGSMSGSGGGMEGISGGVVSGSRVCLGMTALSLYG